MIQAKALRLAYSKAGLARVAHLGCTHIGNPAHHRGCWRAALQRITQRKLPWIHHGDALEAIAPYDKRFDIEEHGRPILSQMAEFAATILEAGAERYCMGIHAGNHEDAFSRLAGDCTAAIVERLGGEVQHLGYLAFHEVVGESGKTTLLTAHGAGAMRFQSGIPVRDRANQEIRLRRLLYKYNADVKIVAHFHRTIVSLPIAENDMTLLPEGIKRRKVVREAAWCAAVPSMFMTYGYGTTASYGEKRMYDPCDIGWLEVVYDRKAQVVAIEEYDEDAKIRQVFAV